MDAQGSRLTKAMGIEQVSTESRLEEHYAEYDFHGQRVNIDADHVGGRDSEQDTCVISARSTDKDTRWWSDFQRAHTATKQLRLILISCPGCSSDDGE